MVQTGIPCVVIVRLLARNQFWLPVRGAFNPASAYDLPTSSHCGLCFLQHVEGFAPTWNIELSRLIYVQDSVMIVTSLNLYRFLWSFVIIRLSERNFSIIFPFGQFVPC